MEVFVSANCMDFHKVTEFSMSHYDLWKNFQDIVENILEMALVDVGGSIETLEKFLDEVAYSDDYADGPKQAVFKDIVKQLLAYESFESFRDMMITAAHYKISEKGHGASSGALVDDEDADITYYIDTLTSMGYKASSIDTALGNVCDPSKVTLESLMEDIASIEAGQSVKTPIGKEEPGGFAARLGSAGGSENDQQQQQLQYGTDEADTSDEPWINYRRYCAKLAEALATHRGEQESGREVNWGDDDEDGGKVTEKDSDAIQIPKDDHNEVDAKFIMAQSVLDSFNQGDTSADLVAFLHWATSMLELLSEVESAYYADANGDGVGFREYSSGRAPDGIVLQYAHLDALRIKIESEGSGNSGLSDVELKRMAQLKAIADMGTSDEQLLHSLISRHEEVRREITELHKKCSLYVSSHTNIRRENLEELYLFLKEKVRGGQELTAEMTDEMHEMIYNTTVGKSPELAMEVLSLLLELNVLEDEEIMVRARIQDIVGGSPTKSNAAGEDNSSNDNEPGLFDGFDSNRAEDRDAKLERGGDSGGNKHGGEDDTIAGVAHAKGTSDAPSVAEAKDCSSSSADAKAGRGLEERQKEINDAYLLKMKNQHLSALSSLKDRLKVEKDRRLQDLEDRLMRRKLARKKLLASGGEVSKDDLDGDEVIEKQIAETCKQMEKVEEGMISGLKKKCLFEMKVLKKKEAYTPLTAEEKREADRLASEELIRRYERDQKSLLTSLEAQRLKQKNKILARVKAKKGSIDSLTPEVEEELRGIDVYFKEQVSNALLEPQSNVLLGLSCINSIKEEGDGGEVKKDNLDDDDDYFNETEGKGIGSTREWVAGIESLKDTYAQAGRALQLKLIDAHYQSHTIETETGVMESDGAYVDMSVHMLKVITDAYSKHSAQQGDDGCSADYKYGHGKSKDELGERIKTGILDAFQRSKCAYMDILENNKAVSKEKLLARRRAKRSGDSKETSSAAFQEEQQDEDAIMQSLVKIEELVEGFLEDPVAPVPAVWEPEVRTVPTDLSPLKKSTGEFVKPKALPPIGAHFISPTKAVRSAGSTPLKDIESSGEEDAARIRQKHLEKEKVLMDTLQTEMIQKKRLLDDRLKRKREQRIKTENLAKEAGVDNARVGISRQEEEIAANEVERLQAAYDSIAQMIKSTGAKDINMVDMEGVMQLLDKGLRGEELGGLPMFAVEDRSGKCGMEVQNSLAEKASQEQAQKMMMQDEVKRISSNYSEEKQKLDLAMKVEQARQRSTLQRKLLAKKQQQAGHRGAGYSSLGPDLSKFSMSDSGGEGKVYASGQEAFRMPKSIPSGHAMHSVTSRGMNLAPLMRK